MPVAYSRPQSVAMERATALAAMSNSIANIGTYTAVNKPGDSIDYLSKSSLSTGPY